MHYLVLDTNVYWDMILDRDRSWSEQHKENRKHHSPHLFAYLKRILDNNQIRLVVPAIVVREAELTVDTILSEYHKELKGLEEVCRRMPFLSVFGNDFGTAIGSFVNHLSAWRAILVDSSTKERILAQFRDLLSHPSVIPVPLDDAIVQRTIRRQIMRRCPFHRGSSPSYGDAAVIETIVGIERYVKLQPRDEVLFVTRNSKDFSAPGQAEKIHPDLDEDVTYATAEISFTYTRHLFGVLKQRFGAPIPDTIVEEEAQAVEVDEQRQSSSALTYGKLLFLSDEINNGFDLNKMMDLVLANNQLWSQDLANSIANSSKHMSHALFAPLIELREQTARVMREVRQHVPQQLPGNQEPSGPEEFVDDEENHVPSDPTDSGCN